jgi:hypothetical protein
MPSMYSLNKENALMISVNIAITSYRIKFSSK